MRFVYHRHCQGCSRSLRPQPFLLSWTIEFVGCRPKLGTVHLLWWNQATHYLSSFYLHKASVFTSLFQGLHSVCKHSRAFDVCTNEMYTLFNPQTRPKRCTRSTQLEQQLTWQTAAPLFTVSSECVVCSPFYIRDIHSKQHEAFFLCMLCSCSLVLLLSSWQFVCSVCRLASRRPK